MKVIFLWTVFLALAAAERTRSRFLPNSCSGFERYLHPRGGGNSKNVIEPVSMNGLQAALANVGPDTVIVMDFGATWCGPCQSIAPDFEALADANAPLLDDEDYLPHASVVFIKVDVDALQEAAQEFEVEALPTFVFLQDGKEVDRFSGANIRKVEDTMNRILKM
mmetsp:Transcript_65040/g.89396  ORF Transcript_65040/g.89396 Transcript_65040/m.89396 type:complete len:165 (-) Transcript_65040:152-646(-)